MSVFDFAKGKVDNLLFEMIAKAEETIMIEPESSVVNQRKALEYIVRTLCAGQEGTLKEKIQNLQSYGDVPKDIIDAMNIVRNIGNNGAHFDGMAVTPAAALYSLENIFYTVKWFVEKEKGKRINADFNINTVLIPFVIKDLTDRYLSEYTINAIATDKKKKKVSNPNVDSETKEFLDENSNDRKQAVRANLYLKIGKMNINTQKGYINISTIVPQGINLGRNDVLSIQTDNNERVLVYIFRISIDDQQKAYAKSGQKANLTLKLLKDYNCNVGYDTEYNEYLDEEYEGIKYSDLEEIISKGNSIYPIKYRIDYIDSEHIRIEMECFDSDTDWLDEEWNAWELTEHSRKEVDPFAFLEQVDTERDVDGWFGKPSERKTFTYEWNIDVHGDASEYLKKEFVISLGEAQSKFEE